jgi:recombination protein RecA
MSRKKRIDEETIQKPMNSEMISDIANSLREAMGPDSDLSVLSADDFSCDEFISTGNYGINYAISGKPVTGGFPVGRVTEVFGSEASGKTLLSTMSVIETQRRGGIPILFDTEYAFWKEYFARQGGDIDKLMRVHPETLESVWMQIEGAVKMIREKIPEKYVTMVWDSVTATPTAKELNGDISDAEMAERARLNSKGLRKLTGQIARQKITLICINQTRQKIGLVFGDSTTTSGGSAFRFHASLRVQTKTRAKIQDSDTKKTIGIQGELKVIKNKIYIPDIKVEYDILYDKGINPLSGFINIGKQEGFIEQAGAWCNFYNTNIKFNKSNVSEVFVELAEKETPFAGAEHILGGDKDKVNTDEFRDSLKHMVDKIKTFNNSYELEEVSEEE